MLARRRDRRDGFGATRRTAAWRAGSGARDLLAEDPRRKPPVQPAQADRCHASEREQGQTQERDRQDQPKRRRGHDEEKAGNGQSAPTSE